MVQPFVAAKLWRTTSLTARRRRPAHSKAEHLIGSICRVCLDRVIVLNERQLPRILRSYFNLPSALANALAPQPQLAGRATRPNRPTAAALSRSRRLADCITGIVAQPERRQLLCQSGSVAGTVQAMHGHRSSIINRARSGCPSTHATYSIRRPAQDRMR